ncbi:hypothetical protein [Allosphingosinicella sp.]|uniref:hypothetical protein n=1 Tax=Allosphingosinicella sp. TaxID=2823234 RepID=UPI002FC18A8D
MRNYLIAAAALACAAPAFAQPYPYPEAGEEVARELPSTHEIETMGVAMDRMVGAVMDMPIGGIVEAMDPYRDPRDADRYQTVRDMATRDDPYAEERMRGSIGAITDNMALMTEKLAVLIPVLSRSMIDLERRMDEAMRPYDYDWDD